MESSQIDPSKPNHINSQYACDMHLTIVRDKNLSSSFRVDKQRLPSILI